MPIGDSITFGANVDVPEDEWQKALKRVVPEKFLALNQKAFALGMQLA